MNTRSSTLARRSGTAAILGALLTAGAVAAELVHKVEDGNRIVEVPLFVVYIAAYTGGMAMLTAALLGIRRLHRDSGAEIGRTGRVGFRLAIFGGGANVLFGLVMLGSAVVTGETLGVAWLLFAVGFLALILGQVMLAIGLRRGRLLGWGWIAPLVGAAAAAVAVTVSAAGPYHDIGLFLFFGSWVLLGAAVLASTRAARPARLPGRPGPDPA